MAQSEDRILEAMLRIRANESDWASHMFVFPTDKRIRAAALESGHVCRLVEDDEMVVMCRDASDDGIPWTASTFTVPAIDRGLSIADLRRRTATIIEMASRSKALAQEAVLRARASCEASASARAGRMRLSLGG